MKWSIYSNPLITKKICISLEVNKHMLLFDFDKEYRLDIWINNKENNISIELRKSMFPIRTTNLTEIEVIFLLKDYKKQIIEECKKIKNKQHLLLESSNEARNKLVKYLLDFINNI